MAGILVGVDGSDHSRRALEWAVYEAAVRHAPLTVLTVNQAVAGIWGGGPVQYPGDQDRAGLAREAAQKQTDSIIESGTAESRPTQVTVEAVTGFPAEELLRASAGADMIVVGSRGAGGFRRLRGMGSVANQLTHHAHCPVVVIPGDEA
jgi:nucleotide-binding universal stress UspA family protein